MCGREHANRRMQTGVCQGDDATRRVRGKKLFVLFSVYRLHIHTRMESYRQKHADGNIRMGAFGWSVGTGAL